MVLCTPAAFRLLAEQEVCNTKTLRSFRAKLGVCPNVCCDVWERLQSRRPKNVMPKHLLWGLLFLKVYRTEDVLTATSRARVPKKGEEI
jgi:hypothetical protein